MASKREIEIILKVTRRGASTETIQKLTNDLNSISRALGRLEKAIKPLVELEKLRFTNTIKSVNYLENTFSKAATSANSLLRVLRQLNVESAKGIIVNVPRIETVTPITGPPVSKGSRARGAEVSYEAGYQKLKQLNASILEQKLKMGVIDANSLEYFKLRLSLEQKELNYLENALKLDAQRKILNEQSRVALEREITLKRHSVVETEKLLKAEKLRLEQTRLTSDEVFLKQRLTLKGFELMLAKQTVWLTGFSIFFGATALITKSFGVWVEKEDELARAMRVLNSQTKSMNEIHDEAIKKLDNYYRTLNVSYKESAEVLYQLGSAGLTAEESLAALDSTIKMLKATEADATTITKLVANVYNLLGRENIKGATLTEKFSHIINVMNKVFLDHQVELSELALGYSYFLGVMKMANLTFEETSAILGVLNDNAIRGEKAGTGLRRVVSALVANTDKLKENFGIEIDPKKPLDLMYVLEELNRRVGEGVITVGELEKMFDLTGERGTPVLSVLIQKIGVLRQEFEKMNDVSGSVEKTLKYMLERPGEQLKIFLNNIVFLISYLTKIPVGIFVTLIIYINKLVEWLRTSNSNLATFIKSLMIAYSIMLSWKILLPIFSAISGYLLKMVTAIRAYMATSMIMNAQLTLTGRAMVGIRAATVALLTPTNALIVILTTAIYFWIKYRQVVQEAAEAEKAAAEASYQSGKKLIENLEGKYDTLKEVDTGIAKYNKKLEDAIEKEKRLRQEIKNTEQELNVITAGIVAASMMEGDTTSYYDIKQKREEYLEGLRTQLTATQQEIQHTQGALEALKARRESLAELEKIKKDTTVGSVKATKDLTEQLVEAYHRYSQIRDASQGQLVILGREILYNDILLDKLYKRYENGEKTQELMLEIFKIETDRLNAIKEYNNFIDQTIEKYYELFKTLESGVSALLDEMENAIKDKLYVYPEMLKDAIEYALENQNWDILKNIGLDTTEIEQVSKMLYNLQTTNLANLEVQMSRIRIRLSEGNVPIEERQELLAKLLQLTEEYMRAEGETETVIENYELINKELESMGTTLAELQKISESRVDIRMTDTTYETVRNMQTLNDILKEIQNRSKIILNIETKKLGGGGEVENYSHLLSATPVAGGGETTTTISANSATIQESTPVGNAPTAVLGGDIFGGEAQKVLPADYNEWFMGDLSEWTDAEWQLVNKQLAQANINNFLSAIMENIANNVGDNITDENYLTDIRNILEKVFSDKKVDYEEIEIARDDIVNTLQNKYKVDFRELHKLGLGYQGIEDTIRTYILSELFHYASGGKVPGYGGGDIVPALLEPGEFVIPKEAVAKYGADFFTQFQRYQTGGQVARTAQAITSGNARIVYPIGQQPPKQITPQYTYWENVWKYMEEHQDPVQSLIVGLLEGFIGSAISLIKSPYDTGKLILNTTKEYMEMYRDERSPFINAGLGFLVGAVNAGVTFGRDVKSQVEVVKKLFKEDTPPHVKTKIAGDIVGSIAFMVLLGKAANTYKAYNEATLKEFQSIAGRTVDLPPKPAGEVITQIGEKTPANAINVARKAAEGLKRNDIPYIFTRDSVEMLKSLNNWLIKPLRPDAFHNLMKKLDLEIRYFDWTVVPHGEIPDVFRLIHTSEGRSLNIIIDRINKTVEIPIAFPGLPRGSAYQATILLPQVKAILTLLEGRNVANLFRLIGKDVISPIILLTAAKSKLSRIIKVSNRPGLIDWSKGGFIRSLIGGSNEARATFNSFIKEVASAKNMNMEEWLSIELKLPESLFKKIDKDAGFMQLTKRRSMTLREILERLSKHESKTGFLTAGYGGDLQSGLGIIVDTLDYGNLLTRYKFARGGKVPGVGRGDTVPALLEPGEFVIPRAAVEKYGEQYFAQYLKFAGGGAVPEPSFKSENVIVVKAASVEKNTDIKDKIRGEVQQYIQNVKQSNELLNNQDTLVASLYKRWKTMPDGPEKYRASLNLIYAITQKNEDLLKIWQFDLKALIGDFVENQLVPQVKDAFANLWDYLIVGEEDTMARIKEERDKAYEEELIRYERELEDLELALKYNEITYTEYYKNLEKARIDHQRNLEDIERAKREKEKEARKEMLKEDKKQKAEALKLLSNSIVDSLAKYGEYSEAIKAEEAKQQSSLLGTFVVSTGKLLSNLGIPPPLNVALAIAAGAALMAGIQMLMAKALTALSPKTKKHTGGFIWGYGGGDVVPALLERGEYVLPKEVVREYGVGYFENLRNKYYKYQSGGLVGFTTTNVPLNAFNTTTNTENKTIVFNFEGANIIGEEDFIDNIDIMLEDRFNRRAGFLQSAVRKSIRKAGAR